MKGRRGVSRSRRLRLSLPPALPEVETRRGRRLPTAADGNQSKASESILRAQGRRSSTIHPDAARDLNPRQRLVNQHIVRQGRDMRQVAAEFFASIESFGRFRKGFDNYDRVDENVLELVVELRLPADD